MNGSIRTALAVVATTLVAGGLLAGCGDDNGGSPGTAPGAASGAPAADCAGFATSTPTDAPPADLPLIDGGTAYRSDKVGATEIFFVRAPGTAEDLVAVRDAAVAKLTKAGYTLKGTDQEPGAEAEAEFEGPHEGTLNVQTLCSGQVKVRYRLEK